MRNAAFFFLAAALTGCGVTATHDVYLSRQIENLALRLRHLEDRVSRIEEAACGRSPVQVAQATGIPPAPTPLEPVELSVAPASSVFASYRPAARAASGGSKPDPFTRNVQKALKRAGFDPGPIDGKMGAMTKRALERFQRAKGLKVTGTATRATWRLLKRYL